MIADKNPTEHEDVSGRRSVLSRRKSGRKTPLQRYISARTYKAFSVIMEINLPEAVSLKDFFDEHYIDFKMAIKQALDNQTSNMTDPEVKHISCKDKAVQVELLYRHNDSLLSLKQNYKDTTLKIKEELRKIGLLGGISVNIVDAEKLNQRVEEIR